MKQSMKIDKPKGFLVAAVFAAIAFVFQVAGLVLYLRRLPDDWIGIGLYCAAIVALAFVALGFSIQWKRQRGKD